ncbi:acyltransferase family protein [Prauserella oleivorans]|uniref:Acyltransferase family protein n=1 Tax=Prauserella oleivorans TaxID=1478153 RepID=A0ABW5WAW9_9PSEU
MTLLRATAPEGGVAAPRAPRKFRPELQGLRALAAGLVVVYHVWLDRISGGVDVFFLVSGFLITGQLVRASLRGRIEFRPMWGRMIKRLFPAALTVLAATMVAAFVWLPEHRWFQTIKEIVASALYVENWQLAADSVDYFAQHGSASVVQHFWSLSIQGQFYLVWPVLIATVALLARRAGWGLRRTVFVTLAVLFTVSLAYSVYLTAVNQPFAYFTSLTRVWEFALGGLLALAIDRIALPRALRILLGWIGVAGLVSCGLVLQVGTMFPGYVALWPMVSAALVLIAGFTGSRLGADRFLSSRPAVYLGNISYALYLWHWPVLLFYLIARGREEVGFRGGAVIIAIALALSVLTYHLVEKPVRESRIGTTTRWGAYRFGVLVLAPVLVGAGAWQYVATERASYVLDLDDARHPGAQAVVTGAPLFDPEATVVPPLAALQDQHLHFPDEQCTQSPRHQDLRICSIDPAGPPAKRIVVAGDSHALQFVTALEPLVRQRGYQIVSMFKPGCPFTATVGDHLPDGCVDWNAAALQEIVESGPDAVVTMATRDVRLGLTEWAPAGYVEQWRRLDAAGIPVVAVRDNPRFSFAPPECVQQHGFDSRDCARLRSKLLAPVPPYESAPGVPPNVSFLDFSEYFCPGELCPPVIGNVLVYMDDNHVSKAYMETLAPIASEELVRTLGWTDPVVAAPR